MSLKVLVLVSLRVSLGCFVSLKVSVSLGFGLFRVLFLWGLGDTLACFC